MKKVFIFHGTWSSPEDFWFPYIKNNLSKEEFHVTIPNLPNADNPELEECLKFLNQYNFDEETIMVGHSSGCPLILSILERRKIHIARAIFVAWFSRPLWWEANPILQKSYKWEIIQKNCRNFYFINSLDDPWSCNEEEGEIFLKNLWWNLILRTNEWHMGSKKFHQPYKEFPLLKSLIELPL